MSPIKRRPKWDVFLSYSSRDAAICQRVRSDLETAGLSCWIDSSTITAGARIREEIAAGLAASSCVVVLLSQHSLRSRWVLNELDAAMLREIRDRRTLVIPVLIGSVDQTTLPADVQGKHYIDLRHGFARKYKLKRQTLVRSIELAIPRLTSRRQPLTPLGPAAMALMYSRVFGVRDAGQISDQFWDALIDILLKPADPVDADRQAALDAFLWQYGRYGLQRLLMFVFDAKRLALRSGFTPEQFDDAMDETMWFVFMMGAHDLALKTTGVGLEVFVDRKGGFRYRSWSPYGPERIAALKKTTSERATHTTAR